MRKAAAILLVLLAMITAGCDYDAPLAEKQGLPLDPSLFGVWEGGSGNDKEIWTISRYSPSEYSFSLAGGTTNIGDITVRGYPIRVAGVYCVQLVITAKNPYAVKYAVISYERSGDDLMVRTLNSGVINKDLKSTAELRRAFSENRNNQNLFNAPGRLRRVSANRRNPGRQTNPASQGGVSDVGVTDSTSLGETLDWLRANLNIKITNGDEILSTRWTENRENSPCVFSWEFKIIYQRDGGYDSYTNYVFLDHLDPESVYISQEKLGALIHLSTYDKKQIIWASEKVRPGMPAEKDGPHVENKESILVGNSSLAVRMVGALKHAIKLCSGVQACPQKLSAEHLFQMNGPVETGVVIRRGDRITFSADGVVSFGPFAGQGGPEGIAGFQGYSYFQDQRHGVLIARVKNSSGKGGWNVIGRSQVIIAMEDGTLELDVNDNDPGNNTGHFDVKVDICRAY